MSDQSLSHKHCVPCEGGTKPLTREEFNVYLPQVEQWEIIEEKSIKREFILKNFKDAVGFIGKIAEIAESEGHHPDLFLHDYKKLTVTLSTHAIGGLSVNDFVMAVKIDELLKSNE
jgi:4a-hydroxytetrahydrobiopterin dehydratase